MRGGSHYEGTEAEECNINGKPDTTRYNRYSRFGEEPALQCRRQFLLAGLIVIEAWFGGY